MSGRRETVGDREYMKARDALIIVTCHFQELCGIQKRTTCPLYISPDAAYGDLETSVPSACVFLLLVHLILLVLPALHALICSARPATNKSKTTHKENRAENHSSKKCMRQKIQEQKQKQQETHTHTTRYLLCICFCLGLYEVCFFLWF